MQNNFDVAAFDNPFGRPKLLVEMHEGSSISDIIRRSEIDPSMYLNLQVTITLGRLTSEIGFADWHRCRPRRGCLVRITPRVHGALIGSLLTSIISAAAPALAGMLFPSLAAGSIGLALATAGIAVVGALLIRALIPPPSQASASTDDPVFTLTGASNAAKPYEVYPSLLGRHIIFPTKTATGYTEVVEDEIYLRERMTFGYGDISLETLKIGTTSITEFEDVEIEFLNVDQASTLANIPELATTDGITIVGWRQGTEAMTIYPNDIAEDTYAVLLESGSPVTRQTRLTTASASVDISFQGLVKINNANKVNRTVDVLVEYRAVGDVNWITHETKSCTENTTAYVRFTSEIDFPSEGQYDIRVTRVTADSTDTTVRDECSLTAIRSIQSGLLPSHEDIAEVAVRIKASNELNGQIQTLNSVAQLLVPVWDGTNWSAPQATRHPAWLYAYALMGPQLRDPVPESQIALDELKAWADQEPHWTCDMVIDSRTRLADVLDLICATGRVKRGMNDLRYSITRDGAASGVVQHFTPRNSWGFTARRFLDREIHAFRVRVVSERKGWEQDEIMVYADGYDANNATEIEPLSLPGIVLTADGDNEGNAWRLARYFIAVAQLRPEEYHFFADLDHIPCRMGSKIRIVHDVPLFGVGAGRIKEVVTPSGDMAFFVMDEELETEAGVDYRIRIRQQDNNELILTGRNQGDGLWSVDPESPVVADEGDLVMIEKMTEETVELVVTGVTHTGELQAKISAVPAAPGVLTADGGVIPAYDPQVTVPYRFGPPKPTILSVRSGLSTAILEHDNSLTPRIGVQIGSISGVMTSAVWLSIRWRKSGSTRWEFGPKIEYQSELFTGALEDGAAYEVAVASWNAMGDTQGWSYAGIIVASSADFILPAVTGWSATESIDAVTIFGPKLAEFDVMEYRLYAATANDAALYFIAASTTPSFTYHPGGTSLYTRYKVVAVDNGGTEGVYSDFIEAVPTGIDLSDVADDLQNDIDDAVAEAAAFAQDALTRVAETMPTNFEREFDYFTNVLSSDDLDVDASLWEIIDASGVGNVARSVSDATANLRSKGSLPYVDGETYRIRAQVMVEQNGAAASPKSISLHIRKRTDGGVFISQSTSAQVVAAFDTWVEYEFEYTASGADAYDVIGYVHKNDVNFADGQLVHVRSIDFQNVSNVVAANEQRILAENAAGAAGVSETNAAGSATSASNAVVQAVAIKDTTVKLINGGDNVIVDPFFDVASFNDFSTGPTLETNVPYGEGNQANFDVTSEDAGMRWISTNTAHWVANQHGFKKYLIEVEFDWSSGSSLSGAGVLFDWQNDLSVMFRSSLRLEDMIDVDPADLVPGRSYKASGVIERPDNYTGTFDFSDMYVMANFASAGLGPKTAKDITFTRVSARPTSVLEASTVQTALAVADLDAGLQSTLHWQTVAGGAVGELGLYAFDDLTGNPVSGFFFDGDYFTIKNAMAIFENSELMSDNYVQDVAGWMIDKAGNAQFNDLVVTGDMLVNNAASVTVFSSNWAGEVLDHPNDAALVIVGPLDVTGFADYVANDGGAPSFYDRANPICTTISFEVRPTTSNAGSVLIGVGDWDGTTYTKSFGQENEKRVSWPAGSNGAIRGTTLMFIDFGGNAIAGADDVVIYAEIDDALSECSVVKVAVEMKQLNR